MGELDNKPFVAASKAKFPDDHEVKAIELCSQWEDYLRDPNWHPFKVVTDNEGNTKVKLVHPFKKTCSQMGVLSFIIPAS